MWKNKLALTYTHAHEHTLMHMHIHTHIMHACLPIQEEDGGRTSAEVAGRGRETIGGEEEKGRMPKVTLLLYITTYI